MEYHAAPLLSGTAVALLCLNFRIPVLMIRSLDGQCGSGHATSASVDIQSLAAVTRCFAASNGKTEPESSISGQSYEAREVADNIAVGVLTQRVY